MKTFAIVASTLAAVSAQDVTTTSEVVEPVLPDVWGTSYVGEEEGFMQHFSVTIQENVDSTALTATTTLGTKASSIDGISTKTKKFNGFYVALSFGADKMTVNHPFVNCMMKWTGNTSTTASGCKCEAYKMNADDPYGAVSAEAWAPVAITSADKCTVTEDTTAKTVDFSFEYAYTIDNTHPMFETVMGMKGKEIDSMAAYGNIIDWVPQMHDTTMNYKYADVDFTTNVKKSGAVAATVSAVVAGATIAFATLF